MKKILKNANIPCKVRLMKKKGNTDKNIRLLLKKLLSQTAFITFFLLVFFLATFSSSGMEYNSNSGTFEKMGVLDIESFPSGAEIFVDGVKQKKTTPAVLLSIPLGKRHIKLKKRGFFSWEKDVSIGEKEAVRVSNAFLFPINLKAKKIRQHGKKFDLSADGKTLFQEDKSLKIKRIFSREKDWEVSSIEEEVNEFPQKESGFDFFRIWQKDEIVNGKLLEPETANKLGPEKEKPPKTQKIFTNDVLDIKHIKGKYTITLFHSGVLTMCDIDILNCYSFGDKFEKFTVSADAKVLAASRDEEIFLWDFSKYESQRFWNIF